MPKKRSDSGTNCNGKNTNRNRPGKLQSLRKVQGSISGAARRKRKTAAALPPVFRPDTSPRKKDSAKNGAKSLRRSNDKRHGSGSKGIPRVKPKRKATDDLPLRIVRTTPTKRGGAKRTAKSKRGAVNTLRKLPVAKRPKAARKTHPKDRKATRAKSIVRKSIKKSKQKQPVTKKGISHDVHRSKTSKRSGQTKPRKASGKASKHARPSGKQIPSKHSKRPAKKHGGKKSSKRPSKKTAGTGKRNAGKTVKGLRARIRRLEKQVKKGRKKPAPARKRSMVLSRRKKYLAELRKYKDRPDFDSGDRDIIRYTELALDRVGHDDPGYDSPLLVKTELMKTGLTYDSYEFNPKTFDINRLKELLFSLPADDTWRFKLFINVTVKRNALDEIMWFFTDLVSPLGKKQAEYAFTRIGDWILKLTPSSAHLKKVNRVLAVIVH